jgi:hypothetical protein
MMVAARLTASPASNALVTQIKPPSNLERNAMNRKSAKTILKVIKKGLFFFDQGTWSHEELMAYISGAYNAFAAVQCDNKIVETFYGWNCCNLLDPETMGDIRLAIADLETITMEDEE